MRSSGSFRGSSSNKPRSAGAACTAFGHPVSLILVDAPLMRAVEQASPELSACTRRRSMAVIERDDFSPAYSFPEILGFQLFVVSFR